MFFCFCFVTLVAKEGSDLVTFVIYIGGVIL